LQMQDAIVTRIAHAIGMKVIAERARWAQVRAANPNAEDLAWRCSAAVMRDAGYFNDASYNTCEQALQIDPGNVRALSLLSFKFSQRVATFTSPDRQSDLRRADELPLRPLRLIRTTPWLKRPRAMSYWHRGAIGRRLIPISAP
jgi:hypothetical protein